MNKKLIYYWYVPAEWDNIYDLHLNNIKFYFKNYDFKEKLFIISYDKGNYTVPMYVLTAIEKIREIIPDAKFVFYDNDPVLREAKYFYNEIAMKLGEFDKDDVIFFAHNKGKYSRINERDTMRVLLWVNLLYFGNLYYTDKIEEFINNKENICFGTLYAETNRYKQLKIGIPEPFYKQHYLWHYSGTFYWFKPYLLQKEVEKNNIQFPENNRYFAEAFLGDIIPPIENKIVCNFGSYENNIPKFIQQLSYDEKVDFVNFHNQSVGDNYLLKIR